MIIISNSIKIIFIFKILLLIKKNQSLLTSNKNLIKENNIQNNYKSNFNMMNYHVKDIIVISITLIINK
jgi:hypothetical protein